MNSRTLGVSAAGLAIGVAVFLLLPLPLAAVVFLVVSAAAAGGWLHSESRRSGLASALEAERGRGRGAREQAWQNALLSQVVEELREADNEEGVDELWRRTAVVLGRSLEASRVAVYEKDARGAFRLRAQFAAEGFAPLDSSSCLPAALVTDRALARRVAGLDLQAEEDGELRALIGPNPPRSLLVVPVERNGVEQAAFAVHHGEAPKSWTEVDLRFVVRLSEHVSRALAGAERWRKARRETEIATGLLRFAQALAIVRDTETAAEMAVAVGAPLAGARRSALFRESESGGFSIAATSGFPRALLPSAVSALEARLFEAVRARAPVRVDGFEAAGRYPAEAGLGSLTLVPMFCGREPMGVLLFECSGDPPGLDLAAGQMIAELAAATLRNAGAIESLSSSEAGFSALCESGPDLCLAIDDRGSIRDANPAASRVLGFSRSELCRLRFESLLGGDSVSRWRDLERELFRTGRLQDERLALRPKEGGVVEVLVSAAVPMASPASPARLLLRDISELRKLEQQLQRSQKLEVVGALAGGIAHDFNNVLGGILGYASLLRTHFKDFHVATKYVETIERSALRGAELSGKLLSASREAPARRAPMNLNLLVEETLDLLEHSFDKRIRIEKRLDANVRSMLADTSQLQQIVLNLCVNARDAMPQGGVLRVHTRLLEHKGTGGRVLLSVEDDGVGMDSKTLARLFEPFFSTKGSAGTGLGLSIVHGIVKSLGGDIGVKSSPGGGARFDVVLPCQWADESESISETGDPASGKGELILIVDDEKVLRELAKDILETHGYRVAAVSSGEEALDFLQDTEEPVALVILDVVMPGLGGAETLRRVRGLDRSLPVLLSSGLTAEPTVQSILREGASGFIPKPYGIGELTRAVEIALRPGSATFVH